MHAEERSNLPTARPGSRLRCKSCGTEVIVIKPAGDAVLCCDQPLEPMPMLGGLAEGGGRG